MYSAYRRLTLTRASVLGDHVSTLTLTCKVPVCVDTAAILTETHLRQTFIDVYKTNQTQAVLSKVQTLIHTDFQEVFIELSLPLVNIRYEHQCRPVWQCDLTRPRPKTKSDFVTGQVPPVPPLWTRALPSQSWLVVSLKPGWQWHL